jgi:hypothetical protein
LDRWERSFGAVNQLHRSEKTRHWLVVVNSQNIDDAKGEALREHTLEHLRHAASLDGPKILLKHIPLHKAKGRCVDAPLIRRSRLGHVQEQNFISEQWSKWIVDELEPVVIFSGHDHHGCYVQHTSKSGKHVAEYTLRSMMGDFGGFGVMLDIKRVGDASDATFQYRLIECPFVSIKVVIVYAALCIFWSLVTSLYFSLAILCSRRHRRLLMIKQRLSKSTVSSSSLSSSSSSSKLQSKAKSALASLSLPSIAFENDNKRE